MDRAAENKQVDISIGPWFESWRAHHHPEKSWPHDIETEGSKSLGVCHSGGVDMSLELNDTWSHECHYLFGLVLTS